MLVVVDAGLALHLKLMHITAFLLQSFNCQTLGIDVGCEFPSKVATEGPANLLIGLPHVQSLRCAPHPYLRYQPIVGNN